MPEMLHYLGKDKQELKLYRVKDKDCGDSNQYEYVLILPKQKDTTGKKNYGIELTTFCLEGFNNLW